MKRESGLGAAPRVEDGLRQVIIPLIFRWMKRNLLLALAAAGILAPSQLVLAADSEEGFVQLFDGKTLNGWKKAEESPDTWKIEDGVLVAHGNRCHLFYVGDDKPFKNFHLKVDVMTAPHSNGGFGISDVTRTKP